MRGETMPIRNGYVDTRIGQVHFRTAGASGPRVVLLHQTASSSRMYGRLMEHLEDSFQLFAFDTPGFGNSAAFPDAPSITDLAAVLSEAARGLGLTDFHLVGHHTGAAIATQWAADEPAAVRSLTSIGALAMGQDERERWRSGIQPAPVLVSGAHFAHAWERVAEIDAHPVMFAPDAGLRHREAVDVLLASPRWPEAYLAVFAHDYEAALDRVACPLLLICGEQDILHPYLAATAARRPDAVVVVPAAGAYVLDQHLESVAPALADFLSAPRREDIEPNHPREREMQ
jgi:pimeloyl-ACP methyl ester carboxylesterase